MKIFHFKRFKYIEEIEKNKLSINEIDLSKNYFISGHLNYDFCNDLNNIYKCSIVRDPIGRVIAHYKFMVFKLNSTPEKSPSNYSLPSRAVSIAAKDLEAKRCAWPRTVSSLLSGGRRIV